MKNNLHCQLIREQVNDPLKEIIGLGMTAEENRERTFNLIIGTLIIKRKHQYIR